MADAVIVSTARTPIGKAFRGAFNMTHGATLGGHVVKHTVERAGIARDADHVGVCEAELWLDLNSQIHQPFSSARRACSSSSAVSRNIMCLPVTVSVASMKPANAETPAFT